MRHPAVESLLRWLKPNPNLPVVQLGIAQQVFDLAITVVNEIGEDTPELTAGLRKLLEAKDCFVRASMEGNNPSDDPTDPDPSGRRMFADTHDPGPHGAMPSTMPYADDPELRAIYEKLPANDCGYLTRQLGAVLHCRLAEHPGSEHILEPLTSG